jgi:predicted ATP-grasp superfamily ATP-dependent carboligase
VSNLLVTGARAPVALHLARLFTVAGHRVWLADTHRFPLSRATRFCEGYLRLPSPHDGVAAYSRAVEAAVAAHRIDLVVPTCEEVFFLAAARDLHGAAFELFAPPFETLARAHHKALFAAEAAGLGADPPRTDLVTSVGELADIADAGDRVLKPAWSRFASRVLVRPDPGQLAMLRPSPADPWLVQDYLPGDEICCYAVARNGLLLAFAAYRPLHRAGLGAGVAFEPVEEPVARRFVAGYAARQRWTGQLSFDFRRDAAGALHVLECNPRATSGLHFFATDDSLPDAVIAGAHASATDLRPMTVPLAMLVYGLPAALARGSVRGWWADFRRMGNILDFPGDRSFFGAQFLSLAEIALVAARQRRTLQQAATWDIEWNGEPLG